jgi:polyisoprenoid-binding protein YceI
LKKEKIMRKIFYPLFAGVLLMSSAYVSITSQEWKIKDDFSIKFTSKDPSGIFKDFKGTINFDENDLAASKFDLSIDVSSISTGNGMMNKKAQIEEWFDATKYPQIKFVSTKIEKSANSYSVVGSLKIKGIAKDIKIPLNYSKTIDGAKFSGVFNVKRSDYKVGHKGDIVPDVMKIEFSVPVSKK